MSVIPAYLLRNIGNEELHLSVTMWRDVHNQKSKKPHSIEVHVYHTPHSARTAECERTFLYWSLHEWTALSALGDKLCTEDRKVGKKLSSPTCFDLYLYATTEGSFSRAGPRDKFCSAFSIQWFNFLLLERIGFEILCPVDNNVQQFVEQIICCN
jgi:hypothetical protein